MSVAMHYRSPWHAFGNVMSCLAFAGALVGGAHDGVSLPSVGPLQIATVVGCCTFRK